MQEPIRISYYIDESGNTGDLAKYDALLGFGDQSYFSLAAIGIPNIAQIEEALPALKRKHKVHAQELKSAALSDKPGFIVDVVRLICDHDLPYFIEIVDKKFFLCMGILTFQLLRPFAGSPEGPMTAYVRNELAEFLYRNAPDEVFDAFVAACNTPGDATLRTEFQTLLNFSSSTQDETGRAQAIQKSVTLVLDEYDTELRQNSDACRSFLPPPDNSKRGRPIWLLPNLASLMNIYARINRHEGGKLSDVAMIHDEQVHFDEILQSNKTIAESLGSQAANVHTPHSDFEFLESAPLSFARSGDSLGLQIADLLAGFCMRYARSLLKSADALPPEALECFRQLIRASRPDNGIGINQVMIAEHARQLTLTPFERVLD